MVLTPPTARASNGRPAISVPATTSRPTAAWIVPFLIIACEGDGDAARKLARQECLWRPPPCPPPEGEGTSRAPTLPSPASGGGTVGAGRDESRCRGGGNNEAPTLPSPASGGGTLAEGRDE